MRQRVRSPTPRPLKPHPPHRSASLNSTTATIRYCARALYRQAELSAAMAFPFLSAEFRDAVLHRWPLLVYAASWTAMITATVAVAAFSPELAFVWAVSPSSAFARPCGAASVRLPLDGPPREVVCVPAYLFDRSGMDVLIPPLFAVVVVAAAVCVTRAIGLWEDEEEETSS
ncbi:hypothetical protein GW17_00000075 [Ensete ventricosum]|nr:hypothetical protein GW17_00000075 [Ensete ventricosum]